LPRKAQDEEHHPSAETAQTGPDDSTQEGLLSLRRILPEISRKRKTDLVGRR
jgi:hypothetical protein